MELQSILSFLVITEKFKLNDLIKREGAGTRPNTIDQLYPVYKNIDDEYLNTVNDEDVIIKVYTDKDENSYTKPGFVTHFDFTSVGRNQLAAEESKKSPIDVQIRVQFTEPSQDTLGSNKSRKFLRVGQFQFLIICKFNKEDGMLTNDTARPLFEGYKIAQYYIKKYEGKKGINMIKDVNPPKLGMFDDNNDAINQFKELDKNKYNRLIQHLFPNGNIMEEVKTLDTGVASIVNLRFTQEERRTVQPIQITNPTYGLAVTIPFTFEQTR